MLSNVKLSRYNNDVGFVGKPNNKIYSLKLLLIISGLETIPTYGAIKPIPITSSKAAKKK